MCDECSIFRFYATNVNLGNDLDLMFAIPSKLFSDKTEEQLAQYYAEFILEDGTKKQLAFADWKKLGINETNSVEGDGYYVVYYSFAAKQMSDVVTGTIYDGEGNAVTITKSDSIQAYVMRILADAEEENLVNLKTVIVDMLNYGAACQTHFAYNTTNPANSQLSETQKEYATQTMKNVTNIVEGTPTFWAGANLVTDSNIQFAVAFKGLSEDATVSYSFTGHKNNEVTGEVTLSPMKESVTDSETYYYFMIPELVVADARCAIQITVTSGGQTVIWTESIEAYIARNADSDDAYTAFMKFADSANTYLHNKGV